MGFKVVSDSASCLFMDAFHFPSRCTGCVAVSLVTVKHIIDTMAEKAWASIV